VPTHAVDEAVREAMPSPCRVIGAGIQGQK